MTDFIFKSVLCMAVLLAVYHLFLEREKMHRFNRFYLLFSITFSVLIPLLETSISNPTMLQPLTQVTLPSLELQDETNGRNGYLPVVLWSVYICMMILLLIRFIKNLWPFIAIKKDYEIKEYQNAKLVLVNEKVLPHTFLNCIYINKDEYEGCTIEDELFIHELVHVNQKHTLDILFIEVFKILFWFNPLLHFYKRAIQLNHEFLADEKVVKASGNPAFYQSLLLQKTSFGTSVALASNLNFSITKKRFIMMTKKSSRFTIYARQILLIPVFTALFLISCAESPSTSTDEAVYSAGNLNTQPEYPGGMAAFYKQVNSNFNVPDIDQDLVAKIYVSFVIEKDGTITSVKTLRDPGFGLGEEAKRVLDELDTKWKPGTLNGEPVRTSFTLPIMINIKR